MFFYKDTEHNYDKMSVESGSGNLGLIHRYNRTQDGDDVMMEAPLFVDLAEMNKYFNQRGGIKIKVVYEPRQFRAQVWFTNRIVSCRYKSHVIQM